MIQVLVAFLSKLSHRPSQELEWERKTRTFPSTSFAYFSSAMAPTALLIEDWMWVRLKFGIYPFQFFSFGFRDQLEHGAPAFLIPH